MELPTDFDCGRDPSAAYTHANVGPATRAHFSCPNALRRMGADGDAAAIPGRNAFTVGRFGVFTPARLPANSSAPRERVGMKPSGWKQRKARRQTGTVLVSIPRLGFGGRRTRPFVSEFRGIKQATAMFLGARSVSWVRMCFVVDQLWVGGPRLQ